MLRRVFVLTANRGWAGLIHEGFEQGIPGEQLAGAAELSVPLVSQIRDGRR